MSGHGKIFRGIFLTDNNMLLRISQNFFAKGPADKSVAILVMPWCQTASKQLSHEPVMTQYVH